MERLIAFLPILIIVAFPLLYFGAATSNQCMSLAGIIVLFLGMSSPILKSMK